MTNDYTSEYTAREIEDMLDNYNKPKGDNMFGMTRKEMKATNAIILEQVRNYRQALNDKEVQFLEEQETSRIFKHNSARAIHILNIDNKELANKLADLTANYNRDTDLVNKDDVVIKLNKDILLLTADRDKLLADLKQNSKDLTLKDIQEREIIYLKAHIAELQKLPAYKVLMDNLLNMIPAIAQNTNAYNEAITGANFKEIQDTINQLIDAANNSDITRLREDINKFADTLVGAFTGLEKTINGGGNDVQQ